MTRHAGLEPSPNMGWPILIAKLILNTWYIKFVNTRPLGFIVYNLDSSSYETLQTFLATGYGHRLGIWLYRGSVMYSDYNLVTRDRTSYRKSDLSYLSKFSVNWQKIPEEGWPHLEMSTRLDQKSGKLPVALPSSLTEQSQLVHQLGHNCPCLSIFRTPSWRERLERETRTGDFSLPTSSFCSSQGSVWPKRTHENSPKWAKSCPTSRPKYGE